MKFIYSTLIILFSTLLHSQTSTLIENNSKSELSIIKGTIIEEASGKPIPGIAVKIIGTKLNTSTDVDGNFIIRNVIVGKYEIEFSSFTYETKIISEVETIKGETTNLTVSMSDKNNKLNEVVVKKTKMKAESLVSLLSVQKNSARVQDGISAESIKRTPDKTTSDVLKRISGASIQDNKFVIIRGLNDRYNTSFLNGAPLPSSEPDRKAFSFDIFPANMIDNLVIYKTASPDLPGEFAGGVIEINTKATPDKNFQSLTIGSGYNTITTGNQQFYANGGKKDWIGLDDGTRAIPNYFPDVKTFKVLQKDDPNAIIDISKRFQTDWKINEKIFSPNTNFQFTFGRFFKLKDDSNIGLLLSLSHSKTNNYNETERNTFDEPQKQSFGLKDKKYNEQILFGGIANFSFKLNNNNNFSFKNLYSINSDNKIVLRDAFDRRNLTISQTTSRLFTSNAIYSGQFSGEHFITNNQIKINWVSSLSIVERNTPNDRNNIASSSFVDDVFQPLKFEFKDQIGFLYPGYMFSAKNKENTFSQKIDVTKKLKLTDNFSTDIKIGYFNQSRNRVFAARQLGYVKIPSSYDDSIEFQPEETLFNSSNMGLLNNGKTGITLFDGTLNNDSYTASSFLNASYLMFDNSYKKLRLVWGARIEDYSQKLNARNDNGTAVIINNQNTDFLPSLNLIFGLNKKQNLRFSFSKTLNRPEFRELAPFLFFDNATGFSTQGDENLKICKIDNFDFRYEIFPGKGQLFSFSAFFKKFQNPIELQALANNSNIYKNADSATNKGIEIEFRTLIGTIFSSENKFLNDFTIYTNLAIIRSKVDISNLVKSNNLIDVPLQGQSPYVFNAGLQYINKEMGMSASANINRIGNRIAIQSNQTSNAPVPAIWEKSRTFLDGQITKSFLKNSLELKFNIQNILKQDQIFYQNNDIDKTEVTGFDAKINQLFTGDSQSKNAYNDKEDDLFSITKFGRTFSFSINYNF